MSINTKRFKPFLYPAAFMLIAGFAFVYKTVLKGNAGFTVRTVRGGTETAITASVTSIKDVPEISADPSVAVSSVQPSAVQVYICGAVRKPGVYSVAAGTILNDAVEKAGGFTADAAVTSLNLVYEINSNMSFYIPTVKEVEKDGSDGADVIRSKDSFIWGREEQDTKKSLKVNINKADMATLQTLPGIGEATAKAIIDYRSKNPFKTVDDLKKVSGIGDAKFEKVKAYITV